MCEHSFKTQITKRGDIEPAEQESRRAPEGEDCPHRVGKERKEVYESLIAAVIRPDMTRYNKIWQDMTRYGLI